MNIFRLKYRILTFVLLLFMTGFLSPDAVRADTALMSPNGTGTDGGGNTWESPEGSPGGNWANWSVDDGLSTVNFITNNGAGNDITVAVTDPGLTVDDKINNITLYVTCQGAGDPEPLLFINGGPLLGTQMILTGAYSEFSHVFTNPGSWDYTHLAGVEIGTDQANGGKGDTWCTKAEALVDYTTRAQTMDSFVDDSYDEYTPVDDVRLAKIKTSAALTAWGYDLTNVFVTLGGSLSTTGDINVYFNETTDDFAAAQGAGSVGVCSSPTIDSPCDIPLNASIYQKSGYLYFTIDLVSSTLGDYNLTVSDFTGDSGDLIGLPKTTATRSVKPPTQSLDFWSDYAKNFNANAPGNTSDLLLARIDTNLTSEGKTFGTTFASISGTITPGKVTDLTVWWKNYTSAPVGDSFADAVQIGSQATPTVGTYYDIPIAGAGKSKGYIYYSIGITDGGTTGSYALNVANIKDSIGVLVEDFLPLPQTGATSYVTDPYQIQVCGDCHAYPPIDGSTRGTPTGAVLGLHSTHARFNPMGCTTCHGDTTAGETNPAHRNGLIQVPDRDGGLLIAYDKGVSFAQSTSPAFGTCTPTCHNGINQTWATPDPTMICNDCHLTTGSDVDDFTFDYFTSVAVPRLKDTEWSGRGHGKSSGTYAYTDNPFANLQCTNCHNEGIPHGDRIIPFRTKETGNMDFFCQNCHGTPVEIGSLFTAISTSADAKGIRTHSQEVFEEMGYKTLTTWRIAALKCIDCHDPHGDNNNSMMHDKVWTGGSNGKGRPEAFVGASTVVFSKETGIDAYGMGSDAPKNTYICEVCHTRTDFHRQGGTGTDHNNGRRCPDCHRHNKGWAPYEKCTECHAVARNYVYNVRQIVAKDGAGGDFMKLSRHVSNGSSNEIVTLYDCVVCHREGDYAKINANQGYKSDTLHNNGDTSTTRMVDLRNVDSPDTGWQWNKNTVDEAMRTDMDSFCMACHDADGAAGLAVNSGDNGMDTDPVTNGTNLAPFNSNDAIRNGNDGFTTRTRVVDVSSQFDTSNPSHHAVKGARYGGEDSNWNANTVWNTTHTLRNGNDIDSNGQRDQATLHCSDCHLSEQNAHGADTAWYMLLNGTADDFTSEESLSGTSATANPTVIVCYKCHNSNVYSSNAANGSRYDHNDETRMWVGVEGSGTNASKLGMACFLCHAGDGFGHIHGRGSATDGDNGTYNTGDLTGITKRRFMPGGHFYWDPGDGEAWASVSATSGCYFPDAGNQWSTCVKHAGGYGGDSATAYARPINY